MFTARYGQISYIKQITFSIQKVKLHRASTKLLWEFEMWWQRVTHRLGKWTGNWRMDCVASTLYTTSEHGLSSITTADAHTSATSSRLNWHPCRFKWTCPFRRKTKAGLCACAITFQTQSTNVSVVFLKALFELCLILLFWNGYRLALDNGRLIKSVEVYIYIYIYILFLYEHFWNTEVKRSGCGVFGILFNLRHSFRVLRFLWAGTDNVFFSSWNKTLECTDVSVDPI